MNYSEYSTEKGVISILDFQEDEKLNDYTMMFDAIMGAPSRIVAIDRARVTEVFFDLKSGLAGEILQKASTYRRSILFYGDFSNLGSKSLVDFIFESNRTGKIIFASSIDECVKLLRI